MSDIVEKFTAHLKNVLTRVLCLAVETNKDEIQPEHLLWGIATEEGALGSEVLKRSGVSAELLQNFLGITAQMMSGEIKPMNGAIPKLSNTAKQVIEKAVLAANAFDHRFVGTEHLLIGIVQSPCIEVQNFFTITEIRTETIRKQLHILLSGSKEFPRFPIPDFLTEVRPQKTDERKHEEEKNERGVLALEYFGTELTTHDALELLDPVIGREEEMQRVMEILSRRTKNNPVLIGEPGVGKTAIVEGIARRIVDGSAPAPLLSKRIFSLDLGSLLAGTMYRGDFESRVKQILEEVMERPDVILFVDEVHNLVGAGSSSGAMDAANMLKPALARGEIRMIGATTPAEYKKFIETDRALERRLCPVRVEEPSVEDTVLMLRALVPSYSAFHGVQIPEATIRFAAEASSKHIHGRHLPDKAVDLLDEAASRIRLQNTSAPSEIFKTATELRKIRNALDEAGIAQTKDEYAKLKEHECDLEQSLNTMASEVLLSGDVVLTPEHIASSIERMLGLQDGEILAKEKERWSTLSSTLENEIFGQSHIVLPVADHLKKARLGLQDPNRPTGSFLFVGPSGTGKTELARTLARTVFGGEKSLLRLDMSEYAEGYSVSKLLGSPAGYVGYREGARLTDAVRERPYSVVLFDEIEKAHSDVHHLLLQILEKGELTDSSGRTVSFRHALIILTSNVGAELFERGQMGFGAREIDESDIRKKLKDTFRPELLNRLDGIHVFKPLDAISLSLIANRELGAVANRLLAHKKKFTWTKTLVSAIVSYSQKPGIEGGARAVHRLVQEMVENRLAEMLTMANSPAHIHGTWAKDAVVFARR